MSTTYRFRVVGWNDDQWEPWSEWFDTFAEAETAMLGLIDRRNPYARVIEERTETTYTIKARSTHYEGGPEQIVATMRGAPEHQL